MTENEITPIERRQYQHHNQVIAKGASDIYNSLRVMHEKRLYREEYDTFEEYCRGKWGMSDQHARNLLKHGQILRVIEEDPKNQTIVGSIRESHTREVSDLPPEEAAAIIVETAERNDGKVTATAVRETRSGDPFDVPFDVPEGANGEGAISSEGQEAHQEDNRPHRPPKRKGTEASGGSSKRTIRTPEHEFDIQKSKTVKTVEAAIRAFDDLNALQKMPEWHDTAIDEAKSLLSKAQNWKYANR